MEQESKDYREELEEKIKECIDELDDEELVQLNNDYCDAWKLEDYIYSTDDIDDILFAKRPSEIAEMIANGDFSIIVPYFAFDGYDHMYSIDNVREEIDIDGIVTYMIEEKDGLNISEIDDLLEEYEEMYSEEELD